MRKAKAGNSTLRLLGGQNFGVRDTRTPDDKYSWLLTGKSLEIIPLGINHVKIGSDHYQW